MPTLVLAVVLGSVPCGELPLKPGSTWTYRAEVAWAAGGSDSARHQTLSWTTTLLTIRTSGSAVAATVLGWPTDLAWWEPERTPTTSVIYCSGGRVYVLHPPSGTAAGVATALLRGEQRPAVDDLVLQFPLHTGQLFGRDAAERPDTFYAWFVAAAEPIPAAVRRLRSGLTDSLYSVIYRTLPDHTVVGFVPGLGVAHYVYMHHGTIAEADAWLVAYHEGEVLNPETRSGGR